MNEQERRELLDEFRQRILACMPWISERLIVEMFELALKEPLQS